MATWMAGLTVDCPTCGAKAHKPCYSPTYKVRLKVNVQHQSRIEMGQRKWDDRQGHKQVSS